jgi:hypothetical protein
MLLYHGNFLLGLLGQRKKRQFRSPPSQSSLGLIIPRQYGRPGCRGIRKILLQGTEVKAGTRDHMRNGDRTCLRDKDRKKIRKLG